MEAPSWFIPSVFTFLLTIIFTLAGLAYASITNRLARLEVMYYNQMRVMFVLLMKLHPDDAEAVTGALNEVLKQQGARNGK